MSEKYIKELREHLFEIYKYRRNDRTLTYNMSIELLSRTCTTLDYLQQEITRLNNIINELEKTLLEWHEYWEDDDDYTFEYKNAYDYLQELKENK